MRHGDTFELRPPHNPEGQQPTTWVVMDPPESTPTHVVTAAPLDPQFGTLGDHKQFYLPRLQEILKEQPDQ